MGNDRFDDVMRLLTQRRLSRAAALRGLGLSALGLVVSGASPGGAKHKKKSKKKKPVCLCATTDATSCIDAKAKSKKARTLATTACNYEGKCQPGVVGPQCAPFPPPSGCPGGQTPCGQTCVNLQGDAANCGACGQVCAATLACEAGNCCLPATANLQAAISAAAVGATLRLCAGTWTVGSTVEIARDLTLIGAGAGQTILDGGNAVRVVTIAAGAEVTLQDLTIARGSANLGAGLFNEKTARLRGVIVTDNHATLQGGGIFNGGDLTLLHGSRVAANGTSKAGGGIYNASSGTVTLEAGSTIGGDRPEDANSATDSGGGIHNLGGTITMADGSRVAGNTANFGGGIWSSGAVTLRNGSRVVDNSAGAGGGLLNGSGGTLTLKEGSRVSGNSASGVGGGIYNVSATATLVLEAGSLVGGTSAADANTADAGGGILNNFGVVTLKSGSRVSGNTASAGNIGGIQNSNGGTVTLEAGALICDNSAPQCGGSPITGACPNPADGTCD